MSNYQTAVQESAQALFCALVDYVGASKSDTIFDIKKFATYDDFKKEWDSKNRSSTIKQVHEGRVDAPGVPLKDIEKLLTDDVDWYKSSVQIAKKIIQEVQSINQNFTKIKPPNWSHLFYARDDKEIAGGIAELFNLANATQRKLNALPNAKRSSMFLQINKWNPADVYFASDKTKKDIEAMIAETRGTSLTFPQLNSFLSRLIDSGDLLPLSLKQQPGDVTIQKVNFDRKQELAIIGKFEYLGHKPWKPYTKAKPEARFLDISYDPAHPKSSIYIRHDPATSAFKAEVVHKAGGATARAREGSASPPIMANLIALAEGNTNYSRKFLSTFEKAESEFSKIRKTRQYIDLKVKDRKKFDEERRWLSASLFTNAIFPDLLKWLDSDKERSSRFVQNLYAYATARSEQSGRFIIVK